MGITMVRFSERDGAVSERRDSGETRRDSLGRDFARELPQD